MSLFRVVLNSNMLRVTLNIPSTITGNCKCKTLETFLPLTRRSYTVSSNIKLKTSDVKEPEVNQVSEEKELIYTAKLTKYVFRLKFLSLLSSLSGLVIQPFFYVKAVSEPSIPAITLSLSAVLGIFSIITPIGLHFIVKKYVIRIDYVRKSDKYIATVYNFFGMKRKIEFTPDDVTIPTVLGAFTTCAIKKSAVLIDANEFTDQYHYRRIMGYDKPFDVINENFNYSKKK